MRYWPCSHYLATQESFHRQEARRLQLAPLQAPHDFWNKIRWYLGGKSRAQAARAQQVQANLQEAERFQQGEAGEQALLLSLAHQLDDSWVLLQDYLPPPPWRAGGDIDGVLIGPRGVIVFEAKAWKGFFYYSGDDWYYQRSQHAPWEVAHANPTKQVLANTERLHQTLERLGFGHVPIQPLIALAQDHMVLTIDQHVPPAVPLYITSPVPEDIQRYLGKRLLSPAQVERLVNGLLKAAYGQRSLEHF